MALRSRVRLLPWNEIAEVAARENGGALKATDEAVFLLPAELSGFGKAIAVIGDSVRQGRLSPEGEAAQRRLATKGRLAQAVKLVLLIALAAMVGYIWTATEALRTAP